jgi:negative regulator of sigma E activity
LQWIENLAARARSEQVPAIEVVAPRVEPVVYRLPRWALSVSAAGSLAAACLLLVIGLHAQQSVNSSSSSAQSNETMTVLFAPLKMGVN